MDAREKLILPYIKNKDVLDLGVGDIRDRFLHKFISNNSKECIGVELNKKRAEKLLKKGYNIIIGNAETINLNKEFDVVIAGDLIEHIDNTGIFLENIKRHTKKGGIIILNTPNIYSINFLEDSSWEEMSNNFLTGYNEELLIECLRRHNMKPFRIIYFSHKEKKSKVLLLDFFPYFQKNGMKI